ncbi:DUF6636 domain-containing protein [Jongsikchunia kroppenstedtii]|uniref:DUF6636 domain-containing protein n=1 Tax=Jongsikchunia kroppenstedtii TaxID=1121721 RepID=UPI00036F9C53|nr:DUF6636 domain-containing protein [Jongsikchunia kroppenstedtii]
MKFRLTTAMLIGIGALLAGCGQDHASQSDVSVPQSSTPSTIGTGDSTSAGSVPTPRESQPETADPAHYRDGIGDDVAFVSPTKNIWCRLGAAKFTAGCQAKDAPVPAGAEKSCAGNEMYPPNSLSRGFWFEGDSVVPSCFNQGIFTSPHPKALPYGYTISANGYTCTSREDGMTCTNGSGHGFVMSMQQARQF